MKRICILVFALTFSILNAHPVSASDSCKQLNIPFQADNLLTVTMKSITIVEKTGSIQLTITYQQTNNTSDRKLDEESFKLFFTDGTSTPQYGFFGSFFPGDSRERSYTWEYLKAQSPMVITYNAGFFATESNSSKLNWAPPGQACNLVAPAVKAKQEAEAKAKQEAEAKAAAAASDAASKAIDAANKATEAANKAAAEAEEKARIEAARQAEIAEAARQVAIAESSNKAAAETAKTKTTITCIKGKKVKKVTAVNPKCPSGYRKK